MHALVCTAEVIGCLSKSAFAWICIDQYFFRFDTEKNPENALYLDCFCVVANGIGVSTYVNLLVNKITILFSQNDASGEKLKDLAIEMNLTPSALEYIKTKVPDKGLVVQHSTSFKVLFSDTIPYFIHFFLISVLQED